MSKQVISCANYQNYNAKHYISNTYIDLHNVLDISDYHIHTLKVTEDSISCYSILKENYLMLNQVSALQEHLLQKLLILGP